MSDPQDATGAVRAAFAVAARRSQRFELRLEPFVLDRWRAFATAEDVPLSELVFAAMETYLARRERNGRP